MIFLVLRDLPVVGTTYIRNRAMCLSPAITLAIILALAAGWWVEKQSGSQYLFQRPCWLDLILHAGIDCVFNKLASSVGLLTTMFMIPVPLAYGFTAGWLNDALKLRVNSPLLVSGLRWAGAVAAILVMDCSSLPPDPGQRA
jgi:hypothetical protein